MIKEIQEYIDATYAWELIQECGIAEETAEQLIKAIQKFGEDLIDECAKRVYRKSDEVEILLLKNDLI